MLSGGLLPKLFHAATKTDPLYPILDERHVVAMNRRLDIILKGTSQQIHLLIGLKKTRQCQAGIKFDSE